jgi:hypothetical protein
VEIKNSIIRVHITQAFWDCGILWPFFENAIPDLPDVPLYFRVTNCGFDQDSGCYIFKIPFLREQHGIAEVYIPREYVRGLSVEHDFKASQLEMRTLGFQARA